VLSDASKYALFHLQKNRTCVLLTSSGVRSPESNLASLNYQGCKSEVCVLGIEKRIKNTRSVGVPPGTGLGNKTFIKAT